MMARQTAEALKAQTGPVLDVSGLQVGFVTGKRTSTVVSDVSFSVGAGEVLAIVGESGSGKSVTSMAILGLLPENAEVSGTVTLAGESLPSDPASRRRIASKKAAVIFQDPSSALNPVYTVGFQLIESVRLRHPELSRSQAREMAVGLLEKVGIPEPAERMKRYPHQFSGGQCQRIMIAMALSGEPDVLIADEPTTALDVTVQKEVLTLMHRLTTDLGTAVVIITHDMGVVADFADRVLVMRNGAMVEQNGVVELFANPHDPYTRALLDAVPRMRVDDAEPTAVSDGAVALGFDHVTIAYGTRKRSRFVAVTDANFEVRAGEMVGLVGESGSGKSTLGKAAVGSVPVAEGTISINGLDVSAAKGAGLRALRKDVGMVFQNPTNSLDPRYTIGDTVAESLIVHEHLSGQKLKNRVGDLLDLVNLPRGWADRYPHELSGGQKQRAAIARAIALSPSVLIADEPTSALDVSVQAKILTLFRQLQHEIGFACLFITHDLAVVDQLCDRVVVMQSGHIVEIGTTAQILRHPEADYTRRLIAASPVPDPTVQRRRDSLPQ